MLVLHVDEAEPGMKLAAPVTHPDNPEQQLLRAGFVLESTIINRMRELRVQFVYVDYPSLDHLDKHLTVYLTPERQQILRQIKGAMAGVEQTARPKIPYSDYANTTRELIKSLMEQGKNPIYLEAMSRLGADTVAHAAAVAHLSLLLGLKLENYLIEQRPRLTPQRAKDIVNLGIAGMLHDVGIMKLPEALRIFTDVNPPTDDKKRKEWQAHAQLGYETIHGEVEPTAAAAVLQHHQHFDGSGFPASALAESMGAALDGARIHVFARIILAANLYDRLSLPPEGSKRTNYEKLDLLRSQYDKWLDPEVYKVLTAVVPPYPPGQRITLSDGSRALVIDIDPADPFKPIVQRLQEGGLKLIGEPINLRHAESLGIQPPATARPAA